ncbi:hypothetical protein ACHAWF_015466 [Thalassiosira exigua]
MEIGDVNHIISDALGVFPRITRPLAQLVLRKTKGNPLFVLECIRSLVDRGLLRYSFRERCWIWDTDMIASAHIADNVTGLLSTKMTSLAAITQTALKLAACFGNSISSVIVDLMSADPDFSSFRKELVNAVEEGFMINDGPGYKFCHDNVQESAYSLIPTEDLSQFHYRLGMHLYDKANGQQLESLIFVIVDQINRGAVPDAFRVTIADLNHRAASKAMGNTNIVAAYVYASAAVKLLPHDHWKSQYTLSRNVFLLLGNAAYTDGRIDEARSALDQIFQHVKSMKDKVDAYYLKISLLHESQEAKQAYDLCAEVLKALGETFPATLSPNDESILSRIKAIRTTLSAMNDTALMDMDTMKNPHHVSLMRFYSQMTILAYFSNPPMFKQFALRLLELTFDHGVSKYSIMGLVQFATVLNGKLVGDIGESYKVGKMAWKLMTRFDATDLLPGVYLSYYGYIAVHIEPLQACADMLKRGFEVGLCTGDSFIGFINGAHYVQKSLLSGRNLASLETECDYYIRLIDSHSQVMCKMYMGGLHDTIAKLISNETSIDCDKADETRCADVSESQTFYRVVQCFWQGHYDRCMYYSEKYSDNADMSLLKSITITFLGALAFFHSRKKVTPNHRLWKSAKKALTFMKEKGEHNSWNYNNKIKLLEAELSSVTCTPEGASEVMNTYNASIRAARASKFIHEEGLACEFAALHCLKLGQTKDALDLFSKAKTCYSEWGSNVKVESIEKQIEKIATKIGPL